MVLGKYAVDYEQRVDYDRLRKERLYRAKEQINTDGLGAIVTWDEANIRYMTSYYVTTPLRVLEAQFVFYVKKPECPVLCTGMNGQCWFGGVSPHAYSVFSLEEAPTCGRGSSLIHINLI